mmetsp:Transcript_64412/g.145280  ORF Transcript_64412/g.145280 Transcript_64412/m.145280 type:complete len:248 (+) Transcript_64412:74-817(+)
MRIFFEPSSFRWALLLGALSSLASNQLEIAITDEPMAVPTFDELRHLRTSILSRAQELNMKVLVSTFERQGNMPDRQDSIVNAACVYVPAVVTGGNRALIYRRVNKSGTQTVLKLLRELWKEMNPPRIMPKYTDGGCGDPFFIEARKQGALDFVIVREPLDRWVSGYFYTGRSNSKFGAVTQYAKNMGAWESDVHALPQAFFFAHSSRRPFPHGAVLKLENIAEEWPALLSLALAGSDGSRMGVEEK